METILSHTQVQWARGSTSQIGSYTGPIGELVLNTDDWSLQAQDGVTAGGWVVRPRLAVRTVTATGSQIVNVTDDLIVWNPGTPAATIFTLPSSARVGEQHVFKYLAASGSFAMTVAAPAGQTIDGAAWSRSESSTRLSKSSLSAATNGSSSHDRPHPNWLAAVVALLFGARTARAQYIPGAACPAHEWINTYDLAAGLVCSQPGVLRHFRTAERDTAFRACAAHAEGAADADQRVAGDDEHMPARRRYYDSYIGNLVWVGTTPTALVITSDEISMGLDAGVPHIASGSLYDVFAVNNSGAPALCAGPAWSSAASRGTGAGTTQLERKNGIWTNKQSLTHCWGGASGTTDYGAISADAATYLGTLYATANGQTAMQLKPSAGSGGNNSMLALFNAYNRVRTASRSINSTSSWTYGTTSWRAADGSSSNRVSYVDGLGQSSAEARYAQLAQGSGGGAYIGVAFNGSGAPTGDIGGGVTGFQVNFVAFDHLIALGLNYAQAVELGGSGDVFIGGGYQLLELAVDE